MLALAALGAGAGYWWLNKNVLSTLPTDLSEFRRFRPPTACRVFAANGREIDEFYLERRIWVPVKELPPFVAQAFVAAEDRRFFQHPGIDAFGIARAAFENLRAGTVIQGGSTLTQQLAKKLIVGSERSYRRKLADAVLAYRLEREMTKEEILELYLNYIYLGAGNHGVEAAARDYFGVSARNVNPAQAATLAGLVPAPSRYTPRVSPKLATERREIVLRAMVRDGYLQAHELEPLLEQPIVQPREAPPERAFTTAYVTQVRREIRKVAGEQVPFERGLQVHTPLNLKIQRVAHEAVREAIEALADRQGRLGPISHLGPTEADEFLLRAPGLKQDSRGVPIAPELGQCFQALVVDRDLSELRAGPSRFRLREEDRAAKVRDLGGQHGAGPLVKRVHPGDVLRVCLEDAEQVSLDPRPWGEGAAVVVENATGQVVALVGGYEEGLEGFVRATQARRQPGSSFKPYVYAARLLHGGTQFDPVLDASLVLPAGGGRTWAPKNYTETFAGWVPLRSALASSLNTAAVRLAMEVGPAEIVRVAHAMGVRSPLRADLTVALGSAEVTPLDQAMGYATIARMGVPTDPVFIRHVDDLSGVRLGEAGGPLRVGTTEMPPLPGGPLARALPAPVAYQVADMLREVVRVGTGRKAFAADRDRGGKTGTTNAYEDAWFVGFSPRYTVAVWIGTDGKFPLGEKETGGRAALPAWLKIAEALDEPPGVRLPVPDEIVLVPYAGSWAGVPREALPSMVLPIAPPDLGPLPPFDRG